VVPALLKSRAFGVGIIECTAHESVAVGAILGFPSPSTRLRRQANENHGCALTVMPNKRLRSDKTGPMGMQPAAHGPTAPTQMLPIMGGAKGGMEREPEDETKTPAAEKKQRTRTDGIRAARAKITRRNSLRKQRAAQKS
jgi:hypothetical protein